MADFIQLIPVISAQNLDGVAQPTFGNITTSGGGGTTATILLSSDKTSVDVGDTFTVKVNVKTNNFAISEYKIVINFDRSVLTVVDQDSATPGTQIKLLDDVFTVSDPATGNIVSTSGVITLNAKTVSGNSFQVNKDVAEIQFQAQAAGVPEISILQGVNNSQLIRSNGTSLNFTTNELTVQTQVQTSGGNGGETPVGQNPPPAAPPPTTVVPPPVTEIPATAIGDDLGHTSGLFLGVFLIATGIMLAKNKISSTKKDPSQIF